MLIYSIPKVPTIKHIETPIITPSTIEAIIVATVPVIDFAFIPKPPNDRLERG